MIRMVIKKSTGSPVNIKNNLIVSEFERLIEQIKFDIDHAPTKSESMTNYYRLKQISAVLDIIMKYPDEIKSGDQLKNIRGVGKGSIERIDEILNTGRLSEIRMGVDEKKYLGFIEELENVIGIGRKTAHELVTKFNITSIEELREAYKKGKIDLNEQILIGLKYYGVYQQQIPRQEIDEISKYLALQVKTIRSTLSHVICGSYRRKKPVSNDVDVLLADPTVKTMKQFDLEENSLVLLIEKLKKENFLLDSLTNKEFEIKYMGFCRLSNKHPIRRIDIRYVPYESYPTALLYFTGSGEFNRKMRMTAQELGYKLSEYGLYKLQNGKEIKIKTDSEEEVFEKLGLEYIPPERRI
jgi:DNA polymerase beta